jgi:hypothetical protein
VRLATAAIASPILATALEALSLPIDATISSMVWASGELSSQAAKLERDFRTPVSSKKGPSRAIKISSKNTTTRSRQINADGPQIAGCVIYFRLWMAIISDALI